MVRLVILKMRKCGWAMSPVEFHASRHSMASTMMSFRNPHLRRRNDVENWRGEESAHFFADGTGLAVKGANRSFTAWYGA